MHSCELVKAMEPFQGPDYSQLYSPSLLCYFMASKLVYKALLNAHVNL